MPGATETWATAWPKLLWYLGGSDPELRTFPMELLLKLARRSAPPEGFHRGLFTVACPLFAPFFLGLGAGEDSPPVANLPSRAGGPQSVAAASERFVGLLVEFFDRCRVHDDDRPWTTRLCIMREDLSCVWAS